MYWQPPLIDHIKLNFDAIVNKVGNKGVVVVVCRDQNGRVMDWCYSLKLATSDLLFLESLACKEDLFFVKFRGFSHIYVEGDSSIVIDACKSTLTFLVISYIVSNSLNFAQSFISFYFNFVRRYCNQVTHSLIKLFLADVSFKCNASAQFEFLMNFMSP